MHDPIYRRLFAFPRMVADLLRAVGDPDWLGDVDLETLEKLSAEHVGDSGQQRRGDAVWRARFRNGWLYLLVLLEFLTAQRRPHGVAQPGVHGAAVPTPKTGRACRRLRN